MLSQELSFSELLEIAMSENNFNGNQLVERLAEAGLRINKGQISSYRRGSCTPRFETASEILEVLGYQLEPEELKSALRLQRIRAQELRQESGEVFQEKINRTRVIRIRVKGLLPDKSSITIAQILDERVCLEYGDASQISEYVHTLISEDLKKYLASQEELENESNSNH